MLKAAKEIEDCLRISQSSIGKRYLSRSSSVNKLFIGFNQESNAHKLQLKRNNK